jgi:photosystem II PsbU protein
MMKKLGFWMSLLASAVVSCLGFFGWIQPTIAAPVHFRSTTPLLVAAKLTDVSNQKICPESQQPIDLNNANMLAFTDCPGFYPTLAKLIVTNGPYQKVEDVLNLPGLSEQQKELLKGNLDKFTLAKPVTSLEMRMPPRPAMRK